MMARDAFTTARGSALVIQSCARRMLAIQTKKTLHDSKISRKSAILIQSCWRGTIAREKFTTARGSAIILQAFARMILAMQIRKSTRNDNVASKSAILIQARWRGAIARERFTTARGSAIIVQSFARMILVLQIKEATNYDEMASRSSLSIQTHWRGAMARNSFNTARSSATIIQGHARRMLALQLKEAMKHEKLTKAVILIQSRWRGATFRSDFDEALSSAIIIQAASRRMMSSKQVRQLRTNVRCSVVIQSYWRGAVARDRYNEIRVATTMIQSSVRGMLIRSRSRKIVQSAVLIQRALRMYVARKRFHRSRIAAMSVQRRFRSYRMKAHRFATTSVVLLQSSWRMAMARSIFQSFKASAVTIQRITRGYFARERIRRNHAWAKKIQHMWKITQKRRCEKALELSILVQSYWRASRAREEYMQYRAATIMIQAMIRGGFARSHFKTYQTSVLHIQRAFRTCLDRKHLNDAELWLRQASELAILVQALWRGSLARERYMQCRVAAMIIQSMVRGARIRSLWGFVRLLSTRKKILNESARKIQLAYIAWRMNIELWELRSLAVLLKRGVQGQLARSAVQYALEHVNSSRQSAIVNSRGWLVIDHYQGVSSLGSWNRAMSGTRTSAAIVIQSAVRRFLTRSLIPHKFGFQADGSHDATTTMNTRKSAALVIQRFVFARSRSRHHASIKIQKNYRRWTARKHVDSLFAALELEANAVTKIQNLYRCQKQKQQFFLQKQAVITIQTSWRRKMAELAFVEMKDMYHLAIEIGAATKIQALQRRRKQAHHFSVQKQAILRIQASWRKKLAQLFFRSVKARHRIALQIGAAIRIQALQRCRKHARQFSVQKQAILRIQASWRRKVAQLFVDDIMAMRHLAIETAAAIKIQALQRCRKQAQQFSIQKQAVLKIQTSLRKRLAQLVLRDSKARHYIALQTEAATKIQALQRCQKQAQLFSVQKKAILKIQTSWRKRLAQLVLRDVKARHHMALQAAAATKIQALQRCRQQRRNHSLKKRSAIMIQKLQRSTVARKAFAVKKTAARLIQSKFRDYHLRILLRNAIKIQNLWRKSLAQNSSSTVKTAINLIQSKYREYRLRKRIQTDLVPPTVEAQNLINQTDIQADTTEKHDQSHRDVIIDMDELLKEIRLASMNIVDGLLSKKQPATDTPYLKTVAARVHFALNEATSLVGGDTQDFMSIDSPMTGSATGLEELEARVQFTLNEAASLSNEDIQAFVQRYPLAIPLPTAVKKSDSPTSSRIQTTDKGTPVRSNKVFVCSDSSKVKNEKFNPIESSPVTKIIETNSGRDLSQATTSAYSSTEAVTDDFDRKKSSTNLLAKQAFDLMREARAAMQKNKKATAVKPVQKSPTISAKGKTPTKAKDIPFVNSKASPKNFGDASMPSPIRPQDQSLDWDWASEW